MRTPLFLTPTTQPIQSPSFNSPGDTVSQSLEGTSDGRCPCCKLCPTSCPLPQVDPTGKGLWDEEVRGRLQLFGGQLHDWWVFGRSPLCSRRSREKKVWAVAGVQMWRILVLLR